MARQDKATTTTALAVATPAALAEIDTQAAAALDALGVDVDDGLGELSNADIKLPIKLFNFKGVDDKGDPIPPNVFYDTVTEQTTKALDLVLLKLHKTNEWREYDEGAGKSSVRCRSFDQIKGEMDNGTIRQCEGCPDARWTRIEGKDGKPKPFKRCGQVWSVFAYELDTRQPCVIRFKKTSLPAVVNYINRHHTGQRIVAKKLANWPLFAFRCSVSLRMSDDKKFALPVLTKAGSLSTEEMAVAVEGQRYVTEVLLGKLRKIVDSDADGDASFDTSAMDDARAKADRFVDDEGAAAPAFVE